MSLNNKQQCLLSLTLYTDVSLYCLFFALRSFWVTRVDTWRSKSLLFTAVGHSVLRPYPGSCSQCPTHGQDLPSFLPSSLPTLQWTLHVSLCPGARFSGGGVTCWLLMWAQLQFYKIFWFVLQANVTWCGSSFCPHFLTSSWCGPTLSFWHSGSHETVFHCTCNFHFPDYSSIWNREKYPRERNKWRWVRG